MKPFQFSTPASIELSEAIRWYETRRVGLGADFYDAIVRTIDLIRKHPDIGTARTGRFSNRQVLITGFPSPLAARLEMKAATSGSPSSLG